jgi:hypothetical protein
MQHPNNEVARNDKEHIYAEVASSPERKLGMEENYR